MDKPKDPRQVDNNESVFIIVQRVVKSVRIIAEMQKVGDDDQARQFELRKLLFAQFVALAEHQGPLNIDDSPEGREKFLLELAEIIVGQKDLLSAEATAIYDREVNMQLMDIYADENATAMFVIRNLFPYAANHAPTVRSFLEKVNLAVVTRAAGAMSEIRVRELINALYEGTARYDGI